MKQYQLNLQLVQLQILRAAKSARTRILSKNDYVIVPREETSFERDRRVALEVGDVAGLTPVQSLSLAKLI